MKSKLFIFTIICMLISVSGCRENEPDLLTFTPSNFEQYLDIECKISEDSMFIYLEAEVNPTNPNLKAYNQITLTIIKTITPTTSVTLSFFDL